MLRWANRRHGINHFVSAAAPENVPSLRVIDKLAFKSTGIVDDGELIFDLHVTSPWQGDSQAAAKPGN